jgi:UDP-N-acetylglucosamine--N-acetylmuramyl-(pentapeptide) pyrophosphoryl-undecaprenol N-acetylglucosamine transferase
VDKTPTIIFTGGGTGGHVYPGLAVASALRDELKARGEEGSFLWIGSRSGLEREIVESAGIEFRGISSGKLRRYISMRNLIDIFKVLLGFFEAFFIIKKHHPVAMFSKGGYVSVPPVLAAKVAGVPTISHESDFDPGLATKINAKTASKVVVSFEKTKDFFPETMRANIIAAGNPVRRDVLSGDRGRGRDLLDFPVDKPILLVSGGSQGARSLNALVTEALPVLLEKWNVVHQTGSSGGTLLELPGYRQIEYIGEEYGDILAAADLVLCRSGATTLWELAAVRKASILVPLGLEASRGDQLRNAELFARIGASFILGASEDAGVSGLLKLTGDLADAPAERERMAVQAASVYRSDAAAVIAHCIIEIGWEKTNENQSS